MTTTPKEQTARLAETIAYLNRWLAERGYTIVASDRLTALDPIFALRITADDITAALAHLGPTGDKAEAYVMVAAQAAAASLAALARSEAAERGARG